MTMDEALQQIKEDFELLQDPNAIIEYILELGQTNEMRLPDELKNEKTKIHGCASDAWMVEECKDGKCHFIVEGSSEMAKGMIPLMLKIFNDRTPDEILSFDPQKLYSLGFDKILSPTRLQGMEAFLKRIYGFAQKCKENQ
ncbi:MULTISPECIES: SufE family protein [unclassified Nitratiruptor]|uniref:SufE family protein n=1 Tax=unclassified Nitratiruptor TaxID=2624044 RepID=UPI0019164CC8|nr:MULTISPECIES: SufE family protein [unclassified Nitratiruptor]BCD59386.1 cysteine desulfuration protein SufE [Nitratiruptor sp. YY08-10]BCD63310.1 cysteine desulfuration protein SufE [Nitratiruptor sp. YY08-14]